MADPQQAVQPGQPEPTMDVFSPPDPNTGVPAKGKIPASQWADAQKAGYQAAVRVTDKDGNGGWVPSSQAGDAIKNHGYKLGPPNQQKLDNPNPPAPPPDPSLIKMMGNGMPTAEDQENLDQKAPRLARFFGPIVNATGSFMHTVGDPAGTHVNDQYMGWNPGEDSNTTSAHPVGLAPWEKKAENTPVVAPLMRMVRGTISSATSSATQSGQKLDSAAANLKQGNMKAAALDMSESFGHALAVPVPGGSVAEQSGEEFGQGHVEEGLGNATMLFGPMAAHPFYGPAIEGSTDLVGNAGRLLKRTPELGPPLLRAVDRKVRQMFGPPAPEAAAVPEVIPPQRQLGQAPSPVITPAPPDTSGSVPYDAPLFDNTTRAQRLGFLLPEAAPEPIQMPPAPGAPTPEGLFPSASTVVHDPVTGQSRVQFLSSPAEPGASFTPHETQLLNDPRGAFSRFMQEDNLGGMSEPFAGSGNTSMTIANPDMPTPADAGIVSRGGHPEEIVQNWLMRSKRGDVFNVARQLGIEVSPADSHSTLIPKILDRIGEEGAMDHMAEFAQGRRGTVPPGEKPPIANPDLSGILQQSIDQTPPRVTGQAPGSQAAIPPSDKVGGAKILKGDVPLTGPTSPVAADISRLKAELKTATDPKEIADIQQALEHAQARAEGRPYTPPDQAAAENLPETQPRTHQPAPYTRGQEPAKTGPVAASSLKPGESGTVNTSDLTLDPKRFQFKLGTDSSGVTNQFKDTTKFNPDLAGVVSVWTDPADGKTYVVNGHHRVELAQRTGQPTMLVRQLEADTAEQARGQGALINIAEGRGSAVDAAKFFRNSKLSPTDLAKEGVSLSESKVSDGLALSKLDPSIFDKVATGQMPEQRGIAIGSATSDPAQQEAIVKLIEKQEAKGRKVNNDTVAELSRFVANSGNRTIEQGGLFGANQEIHSLALDKAELSAYVKQQLSKEKRVFGAVADQGKANILSRVKDQSIKAGENAQISQQAGQALEAYDKLSTTKGPVDDILESVAREKANGTLKPEEARSKAYEGIRAELQRTLGGGQGDSGTGSQTRPGFPAPPK